MARGCGCLFPTAFLVVGCAAGLQGLFVRLTNPWPTELTCAAYAEDRPSATWLALADCEPDLNDIVYEEGLGTQVKRLWVPVHAPGAEGKPVLLIELAGDAETAALEHALDDSADEAETAAALLALSAAVSAPSGLVRFGMDIEDEERRKIAAIADTLDPEFAIVERGRSPSFLGALGWLGLALVGALGWAVNLGAGRRSED